MTKIAVWCRHQDDNIIGIGPEIPWRVSSDFKRFRRITEGQNLVVGERTYESFPNRTLPNRKIHILTFNADYEVSDKENHFVETDVNRFKEFEESLYVCGGASIYKLFICGHTTLKPDIIVDSCFLGDLNPELKGEPVDITSCVDVMKAEYFKLPQEYEQDNVLTTIWIKKGDFVEQSVVRHIINAIENKGEM